MAFSSSPIAHAIAAGINGATTTGVDTSSATFIVLTFHWFTGTTPTVTVSDSKSNIWTSRPAFDNGNALKGQIFYCVNPTVGSGHTFSISGASTYSVIAASAWTGNDATPFDVDNASGVTSGTTCSTGSITPGQPDSLVITAAGGCFFGGNWSVDSGFTESDDLAGDGASRQGGAQAYLIQGAAAAVNPTWTNGVGGNIVGLIAAFKPAVGGGGGTFFNPLTGRGGAAAQPLA